MKNFMGIFKTLVIVLVLTYTIYKLSATGYLNFSLGNSLEGSDDRRWKIIQNMSPEPSKSSMIEFSEMLDIANVCDNIDIFDKDTVTSLEFTKLSLLGIRNGEVKIKIETFDMRGRRKHFGSDFITVFAKSVSNDGRVAGTVIDHKNGTYTGIVQMFWSGKTTISAHLLSSIQHTCIQHNAKKKYGHSMYSQQEAHGIFGSFVSGKKKEQTVCGALPVIWGYKELCNFTSLNSNVSFFCGKPKTKELNCRDMIYVHPGSFQTRNISNLKKTFDDSFSKMFKNSVTIVFMINNKFTPFVSCTNRPTRESWFESMPTGYRLNGTWQFSNCLSSFKHSINNYRTCLRGKTIITIGDSMIKQYAEYLLRNVLDISNIKQSQLATWTSIQLLRSFNNHNITLLHRFHELPFHGYQIDISKGISSVHEDLEKLARVKDSGENLIVLITYNSHLQPYLSDAFHERIIKLSAAIKTLQTGRPKAKVFFKGPHAVCSNERSIYFNAHASLVYKEILFQEFHELMDKVIYLDTWSVTVSHDSKVFHPIAEIHKSQMQQFMSYVCDAFF